MALQEYVEALTRRHRELDNQLSTERQRPKPDDPQLAALKRKKLEIKDELHRLQGQQ